MNYIYKWSAERVLLFWGSTAAFLLSMPPPLDMLMNVAALIVVGVLVFYIYRPDLPPLVLVALYNRTEKKKCPIG